MHSEEGNGAIILTNPDAPINIAEDTSLKSGTIIGLQWEEGPSNGGTAVLDYRLNYDQGSGDYVILYTGIAFTSITVTDLTAGVQYKFKIEARNAYGYSDYSDEIIVLSGFTPFKPDAPTT